MTTIALVLATVNAPHRKQLSAQELVHCLLDPTAAKAVPGQVPGHMSVFFGEVKPRLQVDFAHQFDVSDQQLVAAARAFAAYSYPLAA
jgi:hypothetical protein